MGGGQIRQQQNTAWVQISQHIHNRHNDLFKCIQ